MHGALKLLHTQVNINCNLETSSCRNLTKHQYYYCLFFKLRVDEFFRSFLDLDYSDRVAYRCIVACVGETQEDLDITSFSIFLLLCSCDEANLFPKERDSLCLWIGICVFNILCRRITWIGIKNQICPNPPQILLIEGHISILSEPFYNVIFWVNRFYAMGRIWTSDLGGYGHCANPPQVSNSSLTSVQSSLNFLSNCNLQHENL